MSKLIPGNQKHLTLDDRCYIEDSLNQGVSFKDIARYLCKDPTTISKEVRLHRLDDIHPNRVFLTTLTTSAQNVSGVNAPMSAKRSSSAIHIVLPALNAIRSVKLLLRNNAATLIRLLMCATAVLNLSPDVPSLINIPMTQGLHSVIIMGRI